MDRIEVEERRHVFALDEVLLDLDVLHDWGDAFEELDRCARPVSFGVTGLSSPVG